MKSRALTISRKLRLPRLIAETLEGRRLFSVSTTLNASFDAIVTLQPAAIHADHLAAAPDGSLWYASGGTIERIAATGQSTAYTPAGGNGAQPWVVDSNIVFTADNSAWFVMSNGQTDQLSEIATTGTLTSVSTLTGASSHYLTVAHNAVWFTQGQNGVGEYASGTLLPGIHVAGATALTGLAADAAGVVWFSASTSSGGLLGSVDATGASQVQTLPVQPHALVAAGAGSVYFASSHGIWQKTAEGALSQVSVGTLSPAALAPAADGSVWFIDQSQASRPLWNLGADKSLQETAIAIAPLTSLAIGADGGLRFTASSDQSAVLGRVQTVGTSNSITVTGLIESNSNGVQLTGSQTFAAAINTVSGHLVFTNSNSSAVSTGNVFTLYTDADTVATITTSPDSNTITIQIDLAPATQPSTPAAPADPALPRHPANNPTPIIPDDPGSFDGEFTVQPANPSAPLPPEAPRPVPPSGDSYESRGDSPAPIYAASISIVPLARPLHTHVPSHREPCVTAALFSSSVSLLTAALPDNVNAQYPADVSNPSPGDSNAPRTAAFPSPALLPARSEAPVAAAGMGESVSQWWQWTAYVSVAPSLFERRRSPITRIHW